MIYIGIYERESNLAKAQHILPNISARALHSHVTTTLPITTLKNQKYWGIFFFKSDLIEESKNL